jgi:hypothetical protein
VSNKLFNLIKSIFHVSTHDQQIEQKNNQIEELKQRLDEIEKKFNDAELVIISQSRSIGTIAMIQSSMLKEMERLLMPNKGRAKMKMPVTSSDDDMLN